MRCVNLNLMKKKEKDVVCPDLSKDPKIYETSCPKRDQPTNRRAANINPKGAI